MIGFLRGFIQEREDETILLDVGGVGYELTCSTNTMDDSYDLERVDTGEIQLHVYTQMREDSLTLYGFSTAFEKRMFLSLLKVNGVGPKMAIKILSGGSLEMLSSLIEAGDVAALSKLPKVGKKTAEQLILSLKGKLVITPEADKKRAKNKAPVPQAPRFYGTRADVLSALVNLGFRLQDAEPVVETLPEDVEIQTGIRQGLQALSGSF